MKSKIGVGYMTKVIGTLVLLLLGMGLVIIFMTGSTDDLGNAPNKYLDDVENPALPGFALFFLSAILNRGKPKNEIKKFERKT